MVWVSVGTKMTLLSLGTDRGLGENTFFLEAGYAIMVAIANRCLRLARSCCENTLLTVCWEQTVVSCGKHFANQSNH